MSIKTYGPFEIPNIKLKSDALAKEFNRAAPGLNEASGVYIFIDSKKRLPVYAGMACHDSFGIRIATHLNGTHNLEFKLFIEANTGGIEIMLLALTNEDGILPRSETNGVEQEGTISSLEKMMIRVLSGINPDMFNLRLRI